MQSGGDTDQPGGEGVDPATSVSTIAVPDLLHEQDTGSSQEPNDALAPQPRQFYAVRTGFGIRSAVFLHWEDAQRFVEAAGRPPGQSVEYAAVASMGEAERYLVAGEGERAALDRLVGRSAPRATTRRAEELARRVVAEPDGGPRHRGERRKPDEDGKKRKPNNSGKRKRNSSGEDNKKEVCGEGSSAKGGQAKQSTDEAESVTNSELGKSSEEDAWDCMFERLAAHKAETGTLDMKKSDDGELFAWASAQKKQLLHHFQNRRATLSGERLSKLKDIGYGPVRPGIVRLTGIRDMHAADARWNAMLEALRAHKERHGKMEFPVHCRSDGAGGVAVPESGEASEIPEGEMGAGTGDQLSVEEGEAGPGAHADGISQRDLKWWATEQRREFRRLGQGAPSTLTARRLQRLTELGFDMAPITEQVPWAQRLVQLREFAEEHGHCRPPKLHPTLGPFVSKLRTKHREREEGKANNLTDDNVRELLALGFVFSAGKSPNFSSKTRKSWQERFEELLAFKEENGHTVVPQLSGPLGGWVRMQRIAYKRFKAGQTSTMTSEKALQLSEAGFCFDASGKMGGGSRRPAREEGGVAAEEPALEEGMVDYR